MTMQPVRNRRAVGPAGLLNQGSVQKAQKAKLSQLRHLPADSGGGLWGTLHSFTWEVPAVYYWYLTVWWSLWQFYYRGYLTTGISSTLKQIVPQGSGGVPTIPNTLGWPPHGKRYWMLLTKVWITFSSFEPHSLALGWKGVSMNTLMP